MNEIKVLNNFIDRINKYPIIEVVDEKTLHQAADLYKSNDILYKEADDIATEIKKPLQRTIKEINSKMKLMENVLNAQSIKIGIYQAKEKKKIEEHQGEAPTKMKVQSGVGGGMTTEIVPDVSIDDILVFIQTCIETGKQNDLIDIFTFKNQAATECLNRNLSEFWIKYELTAFPGLKKVDRIKTVNR